MKVEKVQDSLPSQFLEAEDEESQLTTGGAGGGSGDNQLLQYEEQVIEESAVGEHQQQHGEMVHEEIMTSQHDEVVTSEEVVQHGDVSSLQYVTAVGGGGQGEGDGQQYLVQQHGDVESGVVEEDAQTVVEDCMVEYINDQTGEVVHGQQ